MTTLILENVAKLNAMHTQMRIDVEKTIMRIEQGYVTKNFLYTVITGMIGLLVAINIYLMSMHETKLTHSGSYPKEDGKRLEQDVKDLERIVYKKSER